MKKVVLGVVAFLLAISVGPAIGQAQGLPRIALLDSSVNTKQYFRARYPSSWHCDGGGSLLGDYEYERYVRGWKWILDGKAYYALDDDLHGVYDYDVIYDEDITDGTLNNDAYGVLILSNTAILTDDQNRAIQQWVIKGGRLIATYGSGYKDILVDLKQEKDGLKPQSGGTFGIHQLWHDPVAKKFGTDERFMGDPNPPNVGVRVTKSFGPTANLGDVRYGADANLLTPRPENFRDALAFLLFDSTPLTPYPTVLDDADMTLDKKMYPAILLTKMSKGQVIYFSFAPEFIVSLAHDLAGHCYFDSNYTMTGKVAYNSFDSRFGIAVPSDVIQGDPSPGPNPSGFDENMFDGEPRLSGLEQLMEQTIDFMLIP